MGSLYVNGVLIGECVTAVYEDTKIDDQIRELKPTREITTAFQSDRNKVLSFIYGKPITNNYLKMHGGIMSRKVTGTRKWKNRK